jgi:CheY-like chemotaxis protein/HPt (histidine-containing phosphotransfer) domain-containing protein
MRDLINGIARASGQSHVPDGERPSERRHTAVRPTAPTVEQARLAQRLILLAEDNETNRDVVHEQLQRLGYACVVAQDGAIALKMWQSEPHHYALLLTDCHMPNLDGFGLTEAIRASEPVGTHLPIIAITANAMQGVAQGCRERGMDDFLSKPLRMKDLADLLDKWLPLPDLALRARPAVHAPHTARIPDLARDDSPKSDHHDGGEDAALPIWNHYALTELIGDNPPLRQSLLTRFLANSIEQVSSIGSAVAAGDTPKTAGLAHTLKSAARSVGAMALGELCQRIETAGHAGDADQCRQLAADLEATYHAAAAKINGHLAL